MINKFNKEENNMSFDFSTLMLILGVLIAVVNIVVEVLKKVTWDKLPTNVLTLIISIVLSVGAFYTYAQITNLAVVWYMVAGSVIVGVFVAYGAMFGFDKLRESIEGFQTIKEIKSTVASEPTETTREETKK